MGRVARYKRAKRTFDVDNLHQSDDVHDDPVTVARLKHESKSKKRSMIVKFDANGAPIDPAQKSRLELIRNGRKANRDKLSTKFKLEGRRPGESLRDFNLRIGAETQAQVNRVTKQSTRTAARGKEKLAAKKEKVKSRKRARADADDDLDEKERKVYKSEPPRALGDRADAPPEFTAAHALKQRKETPNDRARFAKLSFSAQASVVAPAGKAAKSDYEKLQLEAMRARVLQKYDELRKARHDRAAPGTSS